MGNVKNEADSERMRQILADMNTTSEVPEQQTQAPQQYQQPPQYQQAPQYPAQMAQQLQQPQFNVPYPRMHIQEYDDTGIVAAQQQHQQPKYVPVTPSRKTNQWSSVLEQVKEPLLVALVFLLLSLPKFHTWASDRLTWAYSVGGQFSWYGLVVCSIIAGILFGTLKMGMSSLNI